MKKIVSLILTVIIALSLASCGLGKKTLTSEQKVSLQTETERMMDESLIKGVAYAAVNGEEIISAAKGKADKDKDIDNSADVAYRYASVSKQFTAAAIMLLYERGFLDLNDTIDKYFPDYQYGKEISIHMLLCMRSGIVDYVNDYDTDNGEGTVRPDTDIEFDVSPDKTALENRREIEKWIFSQPLRFTPDSSFEYNSSSYMLLGEIVEQVSGKNYEDFLREEFFEPLGMDTAGFGDSYDNEDTVLAKEYSRGEEGEWTMCPGARFGAGDLVCSTKDLAKWLDALMNGRVVSQKSWELMTTVYSDENPDMPYGYGLMVSGRGNDKIVWHTGHFPSFYSVAIMVPKDGFVCTTVSNHACENTPTLGLRITKMFKEL